MSVPLWLAEFDPLHGELEEDDGDSPKDESKNGLTALYFFIPKQFLSPL